MNAYEVNAGQLSAVCVWLLITLPVLNLVVVAVLR